MSQSLSHCHFRISTQMVAFETWDPSHIWSEWCLDEKTERKKERQKEEKNDKKRQKRQREDKITIRQKIQNPKRQKDIKT